MESQTTRTLNDSIVVRPEDLKYLDTYLRRNFKRVEYEAKCEDETVLKPTNLAELLKYENPDFKRLASITINASKTELGDSVEIVLGRPGFLSNTTCSASFRFKDVNHQLPIEDEMIKRFKSMRPWYFWSSKLPFKWLLPLLLYAGLLIMSAASLTEKLSGHSPLTPPPPSPFTSSESTVFAIAVFGILFLVGYLIDGSRNYLFPTYFFCIGRQQAAYQRRRTVAYVIFGVIGLGIVIDIVSSLLSHYLNLNGAG